MPLGTIAAQLIHAAGESSPGALPPDTRAVALAARSERDLLDLAIKLEEVGVQHRLIREPDSPWNGAAMALGVVPAPRRTFKKVFSGLPLLGRE